MARPNLDKLNAALREFGYDPNRIGRVVVTIEASGPVRFEVTTTQFLGKDDAEKIIDAAFAEPEAGE